MKPSRHTCWVRPNHVVLSVSGDAQWVAMFLYPDFSKRSLYFLQAPGEYSGQWDISSCTEMQSFISYEPERLPVSDEVELAPET